MAKVTVEFDSIADALAVLSLVGGGAAVVKPASQRKQVEQPATQAEAPKEKPAAKVKQEAPVEDAEPAVQAVQAVQDSVAPEAPKATREECAQAIVALGKQQGRAAAVAVLEKFRPKGFTEPEVKLNHIDKSDYGALKLAAEQALQG